MKVLLILLLFNFTISSTNIYQAKDYLNKPIESVEPIKEAAFRILKSKCNVCHKKKNKKRVFTINNMDDYSKKIYKQVFKWKRMPKGNDNNLTSKEYQELKVWIESLNPNFAIELRNED